MGFEFDIEITSMVWGQRIISRCFDAITIASLESLFNPNYGCN
jgi:hypothetical protein